MSDVIALIDHLSHACCIATASQNVVYDGLRVARVE